MKKLSLLFVLMLTLFCITACGTDIPGETEPENVQTPVEEENINPDEVQLNSIDGLNEQIHLQIKKPETGDCSVYYKAKDADEYTLLDRELMLEYRGAYDCYTTERDTVTCKHCGSTFRYNQFGFLEMRPLKRCTTSPTGRGNRLWLTLPRVLRIPLPMACCIVWRTTRKFT